MDCCAEGITVQFNWPDPSVIVSSETGCSDYFLFGVDDCTIKVPAGTLSAYKDWLSGKKNASSTDFEKEQWQKLYDALTE